QTAFQSAYMELKKNLIVIDFDYLNTLAAPIRTRFNDFRLWLYPRASPNFWGSMQLRNMLIYTGIYHCRFVIKSRKNDRYSMIYAYFQAMTKVKKPTVFAEITGQNIAAISYNSPSGRSLAHFETHEYIKNDA